MMKNPEQIEAALRSAFPHFSDDEPVTPEKIARIGAEWQDMVTNWAPFQTSILFYDQNGKVRKIEWFDGEEDVGLFSGYEIPEGACWKVVEEEK